MFLITILFLNAKVLAGWFGNDGPSTVFNLPSNMVPFDTVTKYSKLSYCKGLYSTSGNLTVPPTIGANCASMNEAESNDAFVDVAVTEPKSTHRGLVVLSRKLKTIFVSFKGAQGTGENLAIIQLFQRSFDAAQDTPSLKSGPSGMKVHRGFNGVWKNMRDQMIPRIARLSYLNPDYNVIFVGHSFGGAIATLAAVDFYESKVNPSGIQLYTFGQLRVGNPQFARYVNTLPFAKNIYRVTTIGDPFVRIPWNFMGYEHTGQNYRLDQNTGVVYICKNNPGSGESDECLNDFWKLNVDNHQKYWYLLYGEK